MLWFLFESESRYTEKMAGFENSSISNLNPHLNVTSLGGFHVHISWICVLCFNVLFGPPTHIYVLWLIVTGKGIASEFLNFQACVSEIIICMNSFLMLLDIWFTEICVTLLFAMGLTITGRPLFLCLICVERYLAVVHPVIFLKYKPLRYKLFCTAVAWFIVLGSCLFSMFTGNAHVHVYRGGILLQFLLFFSVNLFCCLAVLITLKKHGPGERVRKREEENHMKRRAFYLILIITVTMVFMYAPVILSTFFYLLSSQDISMLLTFSSLCFILAGFVQPVLYFHRAGKLPFFCWSWSFFCT